MELRKQGRRVTPIRLSYLIATTMIFPVAVMVSAAALAGTASYAYDSLGRVKQVVYVDGTRTTTITYSYDASGNRTSVVTTRTN